jgi:hypothetical protein
MATTSHRQFRAANSEIGFRTRRRAANYRTPPVGEQTTDVVMLALLDVPLWLRTAITVCLVLLFLSYLGEMIFQ